MRYLLIALLAMPVLAHSQEYPKMGVDEDGSKIVVFSVEQAQEIDNKLDLLDLLEKSKVECDSLDASLTRVVEAQGRQIGLQRETITELNRLVADKDSQISNLSTRLGNSEESTRLCDEQNSNKDKQINELAGRLKMERAKKWLFGCSGLIIGILLTHAL